MKMPEPALHGGITVTANGRYKSTEDGFTEEQMKQYGRDLLEEAAKECEATHEKRTKEGMKTGFNAIMQCVDAIRKLKETL